MDKEQKTCRVTSEIAGDCNRPVHVQYKQLCSAHNIRFDKFGDVQADVPIRRRKSGDTKCSIEGCDFLHYAKGWCQGHWQRNRTYGDPEGGSSINNRTTEECSVSTCDRLQYANGLCRAHNERVVTTGSVRADEPIANRCYNQ